MAITMKYINKGTIKKYLTVCNIDKKYKYPIIIQNLLTKNECDELINESKKKGFIDSQINNFEKNDTRKSYTCWMNTKESNLVEDIYKRCGRFIKKKKYRMEDLQIVHYQRNQYFNDHYDQCDPKELFCQKEIENFKGPRYCTFLIYLNEPHEYKGGETVFPNIEKSFKESKGTGILFYNLDEKEEHIHPKSLHRGNEIMEGNKWICNVWVHG